LYLVQRERIPMHHSNGNDVAEALAKARSHVRDLHTQLALRRLEWVLCAGFADVGAVEDAFEAAYVALTDADQSARRFEAASSDLERAYDAWLAAALATEIPAPSPVRGKAPVAGSKAPYLFLRPDEGTAGNSRQIQAPVSPSVAGSGRPKPAHRHRPEGTSKERQS